MFVETWLREKRIQTMQSKEREKDALAKEKIEMMLGRNQNWVFVIFVYFAVLLCHFSFFFRRKSLLRQSSPSFIFTLSVSDDIPSVAAHLKTVQRPRVGMLPILQRQQRIQMLEDAEQKKQEIEKEREELTLGGSLFLYQVKWKEGCFVCVRHDQWFWSTSIFPIHVSLRFASGSEETLLRMHYSSWW